MHFCKQEQFQNLKCFFASFCGCSFFMLCNCKLPHGLLRSFLIGKTSFVCVTNSPWFGKSTIFQTWKERMNYKCLSMFFLFGVKGVFLFLITKKEPLLKTSLFLEQQKRFGADLSAILIKIQVVLLNFEESFALTSALYYSVFNYGWVCNANERNVFARKHQVNVNIYIWDTKIIQHDGNYL